MRRERHLDWVVVAVTLALPAGLFMKWRTKVEPDSIATSKLKPPKPLTHAISGSSPTPLASPPPAEPAAAWLSRDPMISPADRLAMLPPDPTPPPPVVIPPAQPIDAGIRLQGVILTDSQRRKAIVSGKVVAEGERVNGAKILKIASDGVVFARNGKTFIKRFGP